MRKFILALALALLASVGTQAQQPQARFTYTNSAIGASPGVLEIGSGVQFHQLTWNVSGSVPTCQVQLDQSADNITWSTQIIATQTCTSNGLSAVSSATVANYVRINITTKSGAGTVTVTYLGYTSNPGGGGGSVVSCTTTGGVAFENGTNNTLTCGADVTWLPGAGSPNGFGITNTVANTGTGPVLAGSTLADWTINSPNTASGDQVGWSVNAAAHGTGHFGTVAGQTGFASYDGPGTVDELTGIDTEGNTNSGGGTVTLNDGFNCGIQNGVSGTLNACYYAPDQGTGANDYALYLAGGKLHSAGAIDSNSSISANSDGVHAGEVALLGQTTAPTIPANSFGFIGPNSASFTSWFIQPSSTAPTAGCLPRLAVPASNITAMSCDANLNFAVPTLTISSVGAGNAVLALSGNTSGTATLTAPATAGTTTNAVASSNVMSFPSGAIGTAAVQVGAVNTGLYSNAAGSIIMDVAGLGDVQFTTSSAQSQVFLPSLSWLGFATGGGSTLPGTCDTGFSRDSAGVIDVGNCTGNGDKSGGLKTTNLTASGTTTSGNLAFTGSAPAITATGTTPYINASAPLEQRAQCSFSLTTSTFTLALSPVNLCTWTLPNAAVVWRVNCQAGWSNPAGTTPTFAVGNNWAQTPSGVGADANIGTTNAGVAVEGFTAATTNSNIVATGTLTPSATIFPVTWWTTFTGSATSGAYHPTASLTGVGATGTLVGFCTIQ